MRCEVHRQAQLQHCHVTPEGMKLLKVGVIDDPVHRDLLGVLSLLVQLSVPQQNLIVLWGLGNAGGKQTHRHRCF